MSRFECLNDSNNWETKTSKNNNNKNKKNMLISKIIRIIVRKVIEKLKKTTF